MTRGGIYGLIKDRDIWDTDFEEPGLDRKLTEKFAIKHRGSVRISKGLFYTKEEWEERRSKVLNKPLP